jgi:hypothetical protein
MLKLSKINASHSQMPLIANSAIILTQGGNAYKRPVRRTSSLQCNMQIGSIHQAKHLPAHLQQLWVGPVLVVMQAALPQLRNA